MEFLKKFPKDQNVYFLEPEEHTFEKAYLTVRKIEGRVYPDEVVLSLPDIPQSHPHHKEWQLRRRNCLSLKQYLIKKGNCNVLDLGCGNGWLTRTLASIPGVNILGLDINRMELEQASRLFDRPNCSFAYGNIFNDNFPFKYFDIIVLNASLQYFPDLEKLIFRLKELTRKDGEIHILDSPVYKSKELKYARERSKIYYRKTGKPDMIDKYFHHTINEFKSYKYRLRYNPRTLPNRIKRKLSNSYSPFPWIIVQQD